MKIEYTDQLTWIHCGEALLLETAALDKETFKKALEVKKNIVIEAKEISQLDTAGIQLILNFILAVEKEKIPFKWQEPSAILIEKAIILGVEHLMKLQKFIKKVETLKPLEQTLPTFIEESSENLREMEETLSSINLQHLESEKINRIFRLVHTIKGNSTLFGFTILTKLMHTIESFLDEIRTHKNPLEIFHIEFLFKVISAIKNVLSDIQEKNSYNERPLWQLNEIFLEFTKRIQFPIIAPKQQENVLGWHIICKSSKDLFKKKLEPSKPFETLKTFGPLETIANNEQLPDFSAFDPELCYLTWELNLYTVISIKEINDYLLWVFREEDIVTSSILCHNQKEFLEEIKTIEALANHEVPTITSIRVPIEKIETVMHSVSEPVIVESIFKQTIESLDVQSNKLHEIFDRLEQNSKELEDNILHIRMVPLAFLINRFPKEITALANKLGKEVNFVISGEQNELDKNIIEKITDPLMHLIRNAIDHGIESPQVREIFGKNKKGTLRLNCYQEGHSIIIEISDDGAGIDKEKIQKIAIAKKMITAQDKLPEREIYQLLFRPGFSTVEKVSDISGRGVGLDIVEKNIYSLGGHVQVNSTLGKGTTFRLKLPLTSAIIESQLMRVEEEVYIIPLTEIVEM
jgi:two-component system chemotaxis sensor kinase CheA